MPYRGAWAAIVLLFILTIIAFWPGYFAVLPDMTGYSHFHGLTGFAWMVLLASQSWLAQQRKLALHRQLGRAMLLVIPLFAAGGVLVIMQLQRHQTEFRAVLGDRLAMAESIGVFTTLLMAHMALRHRRTPALHGGFLLMSVLPLWYAVGTRLDIIAANVPGTGLFPVFARSTDVTMLVMLACAGLAWWRQPRQPLPFQLSMLATCTEWAGFYVAPVIPGWQAVAAAPAAAPDVLVALFGLVAGTAAVWTGWQAGNRRLSPPTAA